MFVAREPCGDITEKIKSLFEKCIEEREPPNSIWLTDTVYCGRKKIFSMIGIRPRFSEEALTKIWFGIVVGKALEDIGVIKEMKVEYKGIYGRIDTLLETGEPVEIKMVQSMYSAVSDYAQMHVEQLSRYCLALNKSSGVILYYVPNVKISSLPVYRYKFDLEIVKSVTDERIEKLKISVAEKDPFILPTTWHSDDFDNWECRNCTYLEACKNEKIFQL